MVIKIDSRRVISCRSIEVTPMEGKFLYFVTILQFMS